MAYEIDGKVYRNLQEQVAVNTERISDLSFGKVYKGPYLNQALIPLEELVKGNIFLIGTEADGYDMLRCLEDDQRNFQNLGKFGAMGPQGEQGVQGEQGPQGEVGPRGPQGIQGPVGPVGPQGPVGPRGPQGLNGTPIFEHSIHFVEQVSNEETSYYLSDINLVLLTNSGDKITGYDALVEALKSKYGYNTTNWSFGLNWVYANNNPIHMHIINDIWVNDANDQIVLSGYDITTFTSITHDPNKNICFVSDNVTYLNPPIE